MVWWCGCCRLPTDTPYGDGKLIVRYDRNPKRFRLPTRPVPTLTSFTTSPHAIPDYSGIPLPASILPSLLRRK